MLGSHARSAHVVILGEAKNLSSCLAVRRIVAGMTTLTAAQNPPNNLGMAKPETVRRIKSYSSESGYVYQYQFQDAHPAQQGRV